MTSVRERLVADHAALERSLRGLEDAAEGALEDELIKVWRAFEAGLLAHLEVEEERLLPLIGDVGAREAIEADHAAIRRSLDELGLAVELHEIREEQIDRFVEQLRAHAAREERSLYGVADERLADPERASLFVRLGELVKGKGLSRARP